MPSKTPKQARFMAAIAHSRKFAKKAGVPQSVGKEFNDADQKKKVAQDARKPFDSAKGGSKALSREMGTFFQHQDVKRAGGSVAGKHLYYSAAQHTATAKAHLSEAEKFHSAAATVHDPRSQSHFKQVASHHEALASIHQNLAARKSGAIPAVKTKG